MIIIIITIIIIIIIIMIINNDIIINICIVSFARGNKMLSPFIIMVRENDSHFPSPREATIFIFTSYA